MEKLLEEQLREIYYSDAFRFITKLLQDENLSYFEKKELIKSISELFDVLCAMAGIGETLQLKIYNIKKDS